LRTWKYSTLLHALDVVVDNGVILADDANAARAALVIADKKIPLDQAAIAVAQREHAGTFEERVAAIDVSARLVRNNLQFTVTTLEQVVLDARGRVAHGLVAVTHTNRLTAIAPERRTRTEVVVINLMMVRCAADFDL
jgi:hypothetical protein